VILTTSSYRAAQRVTSISRDLVHAYIDALHYLCLGGTFVIEANELKRELCDPGTLVEERLRWIHLDPHGPFENFLRTKALMRVLKQSRN
jgi:hypothetical protein